MLFTNSLVTLTGFISLALAQTPDQLSSYSAAAASYEAALETNPAFVAVVSALETDSAVLSSFEAAIPSLLADVEAGATPTAFIALLPTVAQSIFSSIVTAEVSLYNEFFGDASTSDTASVTSTSTDGSSTVSNTGSSTTGTGSMTTSTSKNKSTTSGTGSSTSTGTGSSTATSAGAATNTSSSKAAAPTNFVGLAAAGLAGMMGVVMAL